jgi:hypothetical protein
MIKSKVWKEIPANSLDPKVYGLITTAYRRSGGAMLLHHKPIRPNHRSYSTIGYWYVTVDGVMVRRKAYYGIFQNRVPYRWANRWLRKYWIQKKATQCPAPPC